SSLESRGRVDDVPGGHPLPELRPGAERHERLARVDGDPYFELERRIRLVELDDRLADRDRRANRSLGIVFVRHRCAEERDDGIADELLDRAAMALELVPEAGVIRREQCPDVLGIELLGARGEADEIGEENGDDLALLTPGRNRGIELG